MKTYNVNTSSKAWGVMYFVIAVVIVGLLATIVMDPVSDLSPVPTILIVGGFAVYMIISGINHIIRKIEVDDKKISVKEIPKSKSISFSDIDKIVEISRTYKGEKWAHKDLGVKPMGQANELDIHSKSNPLNRIIIKNIKSFKDYEQIYKELESKSKKKIQRNVKSWKRY